MLEVVAQQAEMDLLEHVTQLVGGLGLMEDLIPLVLDEQLLMAHH